MVNLCLGHYKLNGVTCFFFHKGFRSIIVTISTISRLTQIARRIDEKILLRYNDITICSCRGPFPNSLHFFEQLNSRFYTCKIGLMWIFGGTYTEW